MNLPLMCRQYLAMFLARARRKRWIVLLRRENDEDTFRNIEIALILSRDRQRRQWRWIWM